MIFIISLNYGNIKYYNLILLYCNAKINTSAVTAGRQAQIYCKGGSLIMDKVKQYTPGILVAAGVGAVAILANGLIPYDLIGANVFALLLGMLLNPLVSRYNLINKGINFVSSKVLRTGIVLMGITLSFAQVL